MRNKTKGNENLVMDKNITVFLLRTIFQIMTQYPPPGYKTFMNLIVMLKIIQKLRPQKTKLSLLVWKKFDNTTMFIKDNRSSKHMVKHNTI